MIALVLGKLPVIEQMSATLFKASIVILCTTIASLRTDRDAAMSTAAWLLYSALTAQLVSR